MARRYSGSVTVEIKYRDRGDYAGRVSVTDGGKRYSWRFEDLRAPDFGHGAGVAYDSPTAYDRMAISALGLGSYYASDNRGDDCPDWAPDGETAEAISNNADRGDQDFVVSRRKGA